MDESHQIPIPPSFTALYLPPGRHKPSLAWPALAARYELCEDMAQMLTEQASSQQFAQGIGEDQALEHCLQGLLAAPGVLCEAEARWVVCRLAELLQWPQPAWAVMPVA